jgi:hypothetical protein
MPIDNTHSNFDERKMEMKNFERSYLQNFARPSVQVRFLWLKRGLGDPDEIRGVKRSASWANQKTLREFPRLLVDD